MIGRPPGNPSTAERIFGQIDFAGICWEWSGHTTKQNYGRTKIAGRYTLVHRWVWEHLVGSIPPGTEIDHVCRNTLCANPDHLEPVTHQVNVLRGSAPAARHAEKTHCHKGHEFTPENTKQGSRGDRVCRTCNREWQRRYQQKRRERVA